MNISLLKRGGLSKLSLLAIPLVSLLGVTNVNAAVSDAVALPAVQDNKIVLEAGKEYKGAGFVIPAGTTIEGNDATVYGRVAVGGDNITIDNVNFKDINSSDGRAIVNGPSATLRNLTISNNTFTGYTRHTIELYGNDYSGLRIIKNVDNNHVGNNVTVVVNTKANGITVSDNIFSSTVRIDGYRDDPTTGVVIQRNTFNEIPDTAISAVKMSGALVDHNTITVKSDNKWANIAIGELKDSIVSNNTITGSGVAENTGIRMSTIDYRDNTGKVHYLEPSNNVTLSGNEVSNTDTGILVSNGDEISLDSNKVTGTNQALVIGSNENEQNKQNTGNVNVTSTNSFDGKDAAIKINTEFMASDAKVRVSKGASLTGGTVLDNKDNSSMVEFYAEPTTDEPTDQPNTGDQTAPDVTAPNTGAHHLPSTLVSAIALVTFIVASAAALSYVAKSFKK